jgi:hypothetical protein
MTEGDLLHLKLEIERRLHRIRASQTPPETTSGVQVPPPETDTEMLFRAVGAILEHLTETTTQQ